MQPKQQEKQMNSKSDGSKKLTSWDMFKRAIHFYKKYGKFDWEFPFFGRIGNIIFASKFDSRTKPSRWVLSVGLRQYNVLDDRSILLQYYREGFELKRHTDLDASNKVVWFLLKKSKSGGELVVEGPIKSYFFNRIKVFDGGKQYHAVEKITCGSRISLIFQHAHK